MKWYFAGRTRHINSLTSISKYLEGKGEIIKSDWIYLGSLKPYDQNIPHAKKVSDTIIRALLDTDVFVLISDPEGTDMFVELGVCLAKSTLSSDIRIYIVGEHSKRSLMQLHPSIQHLPLLGDVLKKEGVDVSGFEIPRFS